jgi:hypothetical protein
MIGKASGDSAMSVPGEIDSCLRRACGMDCSSTVRSATRNRIRPPVNARTGTEISKFSRMFRPSRPARASAAKENSMARVANRRRSTDSAFLVRLTKDTRILIGPSIRNSMMKIFRALTFGSLSDASDTDCAKADDVTAVSANTPRPSTRPPKQRACASLLGIKRAIIG